MFLKPWFLVLLLFFLSCSRQAEFDKERSRREILQILNTERTAHFAKDVDLFLSHFKDTAIFVNKGSVQQFLKKKDHQRFADYFNRVDFIKWDDMAPPIISFSDDGSLAYAIVQKQVVVKEKASGKMDTVNYAWLSAYRKTGGEWMGECNVSTNQ